MTSSAGFHALLQNEELCRVKICKTSSSLEGFISDKIKTLEEEVLFGIRKMITSRVNRLYI